MSDEEAVEMRIQNLIYKLVHLAQQRKAVLDSLWMLEDEGERLRLDLLKLMQCKENKHEQRTQTVETIRTTRRTRT